MKNARKMTGRKMTTLRSSIAFAVSFVSAIASAMRLRMMNMTMIQSAARPKKMYERIFMPWIS